MAPLDRAVPLAEVDDVAVRVREHLHLDVPRVLEVPLDVDRRVGEIRPALALRGLERLHGLVGRPHDLHPLAATAGSRLDDQRIADLLAERGDLVRRPDRIGRARNDRDARLLHRPARPRLRSHQLDRSRRRADPDEPRVLDRAGERGVLGEEAVPGMNRLGARARGRVEQLLRDQIRLGGGVAAERQGLVGVERMRRQPVGVGVDRHRRDLHVAERSEDAKSDLSAVGDQDFGEHTPYSPYG